LSPVGLTLSKHNPLATTIRGVAFDESDIETILEKIPFYIEKGTVTLNVSGKVLELVCKTGYPSENKGISKDIIRIERDSWLPIESERYEEDRLVQKATWKDYIINAGLPDEFFHIRYDPLKLKEMGIKILDREIEH